jgi:dolichol-phosphate mannosyltransferase
VQVDQPTPTQLSVVVPVFNESGNIDVLVAALTDELRRLDLTSEIILVDDGSRDTTWSEIVAAAESHEGVRGLSLSRNFGHQNALFAGLHFASGEAIITMDGDLQHPPSLIPQMVAKWRAGCKVVETSRIDSEDTTAFKRATSRWFYKMFSWLSGIPMSKGSSDFRLIDRQVMKAMTEMRDADLFLRGMTYWVGFPRTTISYQAGKRYSGTTKFSLGRMIRFAVSSLLSFSSVPLRLGIWVGIATSLLAFAELAYIISVFLRGGSVPGWASTLTLMSFMFGILFILIGLLGGYLASIFEMLKNRPRFLVNEKAGWQDE